MTTVILKVSLFYPDEITREAQIEPRRFWSIYSVPARSVGATCARAAPNHTILCDFQGVLAAKIAFFN
jgi:hypothetical protein